MSSTQVRTSSSIQLSEITSSIELVEGVIFEPNRGLLVGVYSDQLSAYRARKEWQATLHESFLLDEVEDLHISIQATPEQDWFILTCEFLSATARYAFWRIIRGQSPEEQYRIEAAHVASPWAKAAYAPDLRESGTTSAADFTEQALDIEALGDTKHTLETIVDKILSGTKFLFRSPNAKP